MKDSKPRDFKVSVIIPVYNDLDGIRRCLKSLINQTYDKELYEIIIIDNGSSDGTIEFLKSKPVKFLEEKSIKSSYAARNKGIKNATNEILCFTDSDVFLDKNWIKKGVKSLVKLNKNNKKGIVFGKINFIGDPFQNVYSLYDYITGFRNLLATANIFAFKEIFKEVGYFKHTIISGGDNEWGERLLNKGFIIKKDDNVIIHHPLRNNFKSHYRKRIRTGFGKGQTGYKHYGKRIKDEYDKDQMIRKNNKSSNKIFQTYKVLLSRLKIQLQLIKSAFNFIRQSEQKKISNLKFVIGYIPIVLFFNFLTGYGTFLQKIGKKFNR